MRWLGLGVVVHVISRHGTNMGKRLLWPRKFGPLHKEDLPCRRTSPMASLFLHQEASWRSQGEGLGAVGALRVPCSGGVREARDRVFSRTVCSF